MDFQHRVGSKTGGGGVASSSESNRDRKERLRKLALETIDIQKVSSRDSAVEWNLHDSCSYLQDPYFMKNHLGQYECKLCLTLHNTEVRHTHNTHSTHTQCVKQTGEIKFIKIIMNNIQKHSVQGSCICFVELYYIYRFCSCCLRWWIYNTFLSIAQFTNIWHIPTGKLSGSHSGEEAPV